MKTKVGTFGVFRLKDINVDEWLCLEDLIREYCGGFWIGVYSAYDIIRWARDMKLIRLSEYEWWFNRLQDA